MLNHDEQFQLKERREGVPGDSKERRQGVPGDSKERREGVPVDSEPLRRLPGAERTFAVTPLDMRQAKFASAMRGFDRAEVMAFLLEAAEGYEQALRENDRLRQDLGRLEGSLTQYRDLESGLKSTLLSAQKVADDLRQNAAQEADRIVKDAEGRAELAVQRAQARLEEVQREIDGLRLRRREAEVSLGSLIHALQTTIDFIHEQDSREPRVVEMRPLIEATELSPVVGGRW
jgi:cell division initiation protein